METTSKVRLWRDRSRQASRHSSRRRRRGLTLIELIVSFTILTMLTAMAVPLARYKVRRDRERELRLAMREIHAAIDKYKDLCDANKIAATANSGMDQMCYPKDLDVLVDGVKAAGSVDKKLKFLRRIPKDPFTKSTEWGKRSVQDDPKSLAWGGQNVFSVYTKTMEKAADGAPYSDW